MEYAAKDKRMEAYLYHILNLKVKISCCDFRRVSRSESNHADFLANLASATEFQFWRKIHIEHIPTPSIQHPDREVLRLEISPGWRDPIIPYLKDWTLPGDRDEA